MDIKTANRLTELRKNKGYSQEELADKLGLSRQAISKWERGEASPDTDNLIALSRIYGISLDELVGNVEGRTSFSEETNDKIEEIEDKEDNNKKDPTNKINKAQAICAPITFFLSLLAFILVGCLIEGGWTWSWIFILFIPTITSLVQAIVDRKPEEFALPVFIVQIYCFIGIVYGLWHPYWFIFMLIPLYYGLIEGIKAARKKTD